MQKYQYLIIKKDMFYINYSIKNIPCLYEVQRGQSDPHNEHVAGTTGEKKSLVRYAELQRTKNKKVHYLQTISDDINSGQKKCPQIKPSEILRVIVANKIFKYLHISYVSYMERILAKTML